MKFHALHQLFCQRQYLVLCSQDVVNGYAAGNLLKIQELAILASLLKLGRMEASFRLLSLTRKLHFQRQCAPFESFFQIFSYHFDSLYSKGVLSARRLKNLLKKEGLGKSISSEI